MRRRWDIAGLIAAGTGLGEALLIWDGKKHRPIPSEGGHCDFAARTDREIALLEYLRETLNGRVSWERVVSGIGIKNVYAFLARRGEDGRAGLAARPYGGGGSECGDRGVRGGWFERAVLGDDGDVCGGVWGGGGEYCAEGAGDGRDVSGRRDCAEDAEDAEDGAFMQAFLDKGRLSPVLESMPVRVILDETCALLGAAAYAEARAAETPGSSERAASVQD